MDYDAFISYSHSADGKLAPAVQSGLQQLARPWYRRRALRVFRDETGLSVNPHLQDSIEAALAESRYFVLLASPDAASSPWVDREVRLWLESKSPDQILPVVTGGSFEWDRALNDFAPGASTAVPAALRGAYTSEPLYLDLRWAREESHLDVRNPTFRSQIAALAAPMHGIPKEDLEGEDVRQHRRTLRTAWAAVATLLALTIASIALVIVLVVTQGTISDQRRKIKTNQALLVSQQKKLDDKQAELDSKQALLTSASHRLTTAKTHLGTARHATTVARGRAQRAGRAARAANSRADLARVRQARAVLARFYAGLGQQSAEAAQKSAETQTEVAVNEKDTAIGARNEADAESATASMSEDASDPTLLASSPDTSLLLANAATHVTAKPAPNAGSSEPVPVGATSPVARGALLSTVDAVGNGLSGYLRLPADAPQALGPIAVSPDGKWVAAAETSDALDAGDAGALGHARLYVWHAADGGDPTTAPAALLSGSLDCVSDLHWTATDQLLTVERVHGCYNLDSRTYTVQGLPLPYVATRVRLWNLSSRPLAFPPQVGKPFTIAGRSPSVIDASPITMTPDHRFVAISYAHDGLPEVLLIDSVARRYDVTRALAAENAFPRGETFGAAERWALGQDPQGRDVLWNLHSWRSRCPNGNLAEATLGCFEKRTIGIAPFTSTGAGPFSYSHARLTPNEAYVAARRCGPLSPNDCAVVVFRVRDGSVAFKYAAPGSDSEFAIGDDLLAITAPSSDDTSRINLTEMLWRFNALVQTSRVSIDGGCYVTPSMGPAQRLLLLDQTCADSTAPGTTIVLNLDDRYECKPAELTCIPDAQHPLAPLTMLRRLRGFELAVGSDDRFVVLQSIEERPFIHFGWELWDFGPLTAPTGEQTVSRPDERAFVSPNVKTVVAFPFHFAGQAAAQAEAWDLTQPSIFAQTLPGSFGVRGVAFQSDRMAVGIGSTTAGHRWDVRARAYRVLYADPEVVDSQRSALRPDMAQRAFSPDAQSVQLRDVNRPSVERLPALPIDTDERIAYMTYSREPHSHLLLVNLERMPFNSLGCAGSSYDATILINLESKRMTRLDNVIAVGTSADGSRVLLRSLDCQTVSVVTPADGAVLGVFRADGTDGLPTDNGRTGNRFTINGQGTLVAGTNASGGLAVWNLAGDVVFKGSSGPVRATEAGKNLFSVAFDPDRRHVAVKTADQRLLIWDMTRPKAVPHFTALPLDAAARIAFSPDRFDLILVDGTYLIDKRALLNDEPSLIGSRLRPLEWVNPISDRGSQASWFYESGNALYLVTERADSGSADARRVDLPGLRARSCALAGRLMSGDEVERWITRTPGAIAPCVGYTTEERGVTG